MNTTHSFTTKYKHKTRHRQYPVRIFFAFCKQPLTQATSHVAALRRYGNRVRGGKDKSDEVDISGGPAQQCLPKRILT